MPGNAQPPNKRRRPKHSASSGGQGKRRLSGKGPTPPAEERSYHPAAKRAKAAARRAEQAEVRRASRPRTAPGRRALTAKDGPELLVGRNPVAEALRVGIPATALYVAHGVDLDDRVTEAVRKAGDRGLAIMEVSRQELDRLTGGVLHQGIGLQVPPYAYTDPEDLLAQAVDRPGTPLLVALDGVTDPRNLGAVVRSAAAFGAHGVLLPERRAAGMTATAWRASAGTAARLPVAKVTNMTRMLKRCQNEGLLAVGLDADGELALDDLEVAVDPLVVVVGSEGRGLSRLVGETCDLRVRIPMSDVAESLNASVAAAVTLAEVARRRRAG
jgi:23S rRNA (guanosine2251-2'-O)-methyltransferase